MSASAEATIFAVAVTFGIIAVFGTLWTLGVGAHKGDADARAATAGQTEHENGMPLDAISYDPPAWMPGCYEAYRIYDRTNGQQWWVLVMQNGKYDANYVVLPIGDGNDAT